MPFPQPVSSPRSRKGRRIANGATATTRRRISEQIWVEEDLSEHEDISVRQSTTRNPSSNTAHSKTLPNRAGPSADVSDRPGLRDTLSFLLIPFDLLSRIGYTFMSPIFAHVMNTVLLFVLGLLVLYIGLPFMLSRLMTALGGATGALWNILRGKGLSWHVSRLPSIPGMRSLYNSMEISSGSKIASSICGSIYIPLLCSKSHQQKSYDIGRVARALHHEVQNAQNIFESVASLGTGGVENGLYHTKMWELAAAIKIGSSLPEKDKLSSDLMQLGDTSRDLSDEIANLYAQTNNAFSWIANDFDRLNRLLTTDPKPTAAQLEAMIHKVMLRTQDKFDTLYLATEKALPMANQASIMGGSLMREMMEESYRLGWEVREEPKWKYLVDTAKEVAVGLKEPSKRELLRTDLALSRTTVDNLKDIRTGLESTLKLLRLHRTHVGSFASSMMGFHLGSGGGFDEEEVLGLGAEAELEVLSRVVDQMKWAIQGGRANKAEYTLSSKGITRA